MITMPSSEQNTETAADTQDAETVASVKLDDVTGGWWGGPGPYGGGPWGSPYGAYGAYGSPYGAYGSPYGAARFAAYEQRAQQRAQWYAANSPRYAPWWGY
jgi:hypothetical protein